MNMFTVPPNDYASHMFSMIFGSFWSSIQSAGLNIAGLSGSGGIFGKMFLIYNAAILSVTTFYLIKVIFEGVAGTAYHGEWLGKMYNGFWTPMRIVLMLGLIAPVAGGFSLSQVIVLFAANQAIGVADDIAGTGMQVAIGQGVVSNTVEAPSARLVASDLLRDLVCMDTMNDSINGPTGALIKAKVKTTPGFTMESFGGVPGSGLSPTACGSVTIRTPPKSINAAVISGINAMSNTLSPVAQAIVNQTLAPAGTTNGSPGSYTGGTGILSGNQVATAAMQYTTAITRAASTVAQQANSNLTGQWQNDVNQYGFATLGSFLVQISQWDGELGQLNSYQPQVMPPDTKLLPASYGVTNTETAADIYIDTDNIGSAMPAALQNTSIPNPSTSLGNGLLMKAFSSFVGFTNQVGVLVAKMASSTSNPLGAMQNFGSGLLIAGSSALAASLGVLATGGAVGGLASMGATGAIAGSLMTMMFLLFLPIIMAGAAMAYVIPAMMYIIYTMSVIGWVAAVLVAIVGAPLWAAIHAIPDGEGFVPSGAQAGYRLLLALFAKPSLLVFGFFAALLFFSAGEWLINQTYLAVSDSILTAVDGGLIGGMTATVGVGMAAGGYGALAVAAGGGIAGLFVAFFGIVTMALILLMIYWHLAKWCFGLVPLVADNALRWGGFEDMSMAEERTHDSVYAGVLQSHGEVRSGGQAGAQKTLENANKKLENQGKDTSE